MIINIFNVSPIDAANNKLDIVFIIDRSGSMGGDIASVRNNISTFANQLSQQGIQYRLGLVSYESSPKLYPMTNNVNQFKSNLNNIDVSGGKENGLDAIMTAINQYTFEHRAIKYFVIVGDETIHSKKGYDFESVRQSLLDNNIILTAISLNKLESHFAQLFEPTKGQFYDMNSNYEISLQGIFEQIQNIPAMNVTFPVENEYYSGKNTFIPQIEVSDEDSDVLTCRYAVDSTAQWKEEKKVTNTIKNQTVSFNSLSIESLSQGWHDFYFEVDDGTDVVSETRRIYVDHKPPTLNAIDYTPLDKSIRVAVGAMDDESGLAVEPYRFSIDGHEGVWSFSSVSTYANLEPNNMYRTVVEIKDKVGNIEKRVTNVTTLAQVPVIGKINTSVNGMDIQLADDNPSGTFYQVQLDDRYLRSDHQLSSSPQWITLENKRAIIKNLKLNTNYSIRIKAKNSEGIESGWSKAIEASTLAPVPTNIELVPTQTEMRLSWDPIPNISYYELQIDGKSIVRSEIETYQHRGLGIDEEHTYQVRAVNEGGHSAWSGMVQERTLPYPPEVPHLDEIINGQETVGIYWKAVIGAEYYEVLIDEGTTVKVEEPFYLHEGVTPETEYIYRVRAVNRGGASVYSQQEKVVTYPYPPSKPMDIQIAKTNTSITLSYNIDSKAETYEIEVDGTIIDNALDPGYTHEKLGPLTTHKYRIRGVNKGGKGEWSDIIIVQTNPNVPIAPTSLFGTATEESVSVLYNKVEYAEYYEIEIDGKDIVTSKLTAFDHLNLASGEEHVYRVRACNITGNSPWSIPYTISSLDKKDNSDTFALANIGAIVTNRSISISWEAVDYDVTYIIEADGKRINLGQDKVFYDTNLKANSLHDYKIIAVRDGNETYCGYLKLTTLPNPPDAPDNFSAVAGLDYVQLSWNKVEDATAYEMEVDGNVFLIGDDTVFKDEYLLPGSNHVYRLRALNITGSTGWSEPISISTLSPEFELDLSPGQTVDISILLRNVQDFTGKTYILSYDSAKLRVEDMSLLTPEKETESMVFEPYRMTINKAENQVIMQADIPIVPGTSFDGEINAIRFIMLDQGVTTLTLLEKKNE